MKKKSTLVLFIISAMILLSFSQAYASTFTDMIYSQKVYPETATDGDDFALCTLVKDVNPCLKDTIEITYRYYNYLSPESYDSGELLPLREYIRTEHFLIDEVPETHIWCSKIEGKMNSESISSTITCLDSLGEQHYDSAYSSIDIGPISIHPTIKFDEDMIFGRYVGEELEISLFLDDPENAEMSYLLYNITLGTPYVENVVLEYVEGQFIGSFEIPDDAPVGFIALSTSVDGLPSQFGAKFMPYAAIPYNANITIDGETMMGNSINIDFNIDVNYGKINDIKSVVVFPNGTEENIYLDHVNTSVNYTLPMKYGDYKIETTINHSVLEDEIITYEFNVRPYDVDLSIDKGVYIQGETMIIKVGVIDSSNNAVDSEIDSIKIRPPTTSIKTFDDDDTTIENKYHKLEYELDEDAETGTYRVDVEIEDEFGLSYENNISFRVNELDRSILFSLSPDTLHLNINSMNETTREFIISNTGLNPIDDIVIAIEPSELRDYITINMSNLLTSIEPENSSTFNVIIKPDADMQNQLYYGNISITAENEKTEKYALVLDVTLTAEMTILNKTISIEAVENKDSEIHIIIENAGVRPLANISTNMSGDLMEYKDDIIIPYEILPNNKGSIIIMIGPIPVIGSYDAEVVIGGANLSSGMVEIILDVVEDKKFEIDEVETNRIDMNQRLDELSEKNGVEEIRADLYDLQADINDMNSKFNDGLYSEAYSLLSDIQTKANAIDEDIIALEATEMVCGDGNCDLGETCSSCYEDCLDALSCEEASECNDDGVCDVDTEDCTCADCELDDMCAETEVEPDDQSSGGSMILIIIVVIIVVIIAAVVATSIVPDRETGKNIQQPVPTLSMSI